MEHTSIYPEDGPPAVRSDALHQEAPTANDARTAAPTSAYEIGIKSFLRPAALLRLLRSIRRHESAVSILVADDGDLSTSADPDSLACRNWMVADGRCRLIQLPWNAGVSAGRNALFDACRASYLLLLDDDFVFTRDTSVSKMQARLDRDPEVGVVAGVVIDAFDGNRWRRRSGGTLTVVGDVLHYQTDDWRNRQQGLRDFVPNFLLVRREVRDEVRWDGPLVGEHFDFCMQLRRSRWKVVQLEDVEIDHDPTVASRPGYREFRGEHTTGEQWFLNKWGLRSVVQDGSVIMSAQSTSPPLHVVFVGGHDGDEVAIVEAVLPNAVISVFEPARECAAVLRCRFAQFPRIHIYEAALSDRMGVGDFFCSRVPQGSSVFGTRRNLISPTRMDVRYVDVNEFLEGVDGEVALYLNCEGGELQILPRLLSDPCAAWGRIRAWCIHWHHQPQRLPQFAPEQLRLTTELKRRAIDWTETFPDFLRALVERDRTRRSSPVRTADRPAIALT